MPARSRRAGWAGRSSSATRPRSSTTTTASCSTTPSSAATPPTRRNSPPPIGRVITRTGRRPRTVTADRGYGEARVENDLHELGVRTVVIPRKGRPGKARQAHEHRRTFRRTVKWRTGSEARISTLPERVALRGSTNLRSVDVIRPLDPRLSVIALWAVSETRGLGLHRQPRVVGVRADHVPSQGAL